ncbi:MAG: murein L,D-transpeptidase catalytic domain family protein [Caulobacteraceae bacterium]|nr:murein L,D-transpeptidase catalytic domain family protein [Caulobacteraceae bacterium]
MNHRRLFLKASVAALGLGALARPALALAADPGLVAAAKAGLERAGARAARRDLVGVADFSRPSRTPRLHLVDLEGGRVESLLVAHGRGSDPDHTGWLSRFSNTPGSAATSEGDYVTGGYYDGHHGRSMRLTGLDPTNDNAESREIVVHSAWYVGSEVIAAHGVLGRSEGCFAVSQADLPRVLDRLGPGRLLVARKL